MAREIRAKLNPPQARADGYGIDHDLWIAYVDGENEIHVSHLPCPIPLDRYRVLATQMTDSARGDLYRSLIIEFWNVGVPSPDIPAAPTSLNDLSAWDAYFDAKEAYEAQLASDVAELESLANLATNWIEGLGSFSSWPFFFVLQEGD